MNHLDDWSARMLRKLARVNDENTVIHHVTLIGNSFHSHGYGKNYSWRKPARAQTNHQDNSTRRGARASYQTISPEISARGSLLWAKVQIPIVTDRQGGRYKSAPRPYETAPIHPLSSKIVPISIYIELFFRYFLHVVRSGVDYCRAYLTIAHAL